MEKVPNIIESPKGNEWLSQPWLSEEEIVKNFSTIEKIFQRNIPYLYEGILSTIDQRDLQISREVAICREVAIYSEVARRSLRFFRTLEAEDFWQVDYNVMKDEMKREDCQVNRNFFNVLKCFSQEQLKEYFRGIISNETGQQQKKIRDFLVAAGEMGFLHIVEQIAVIIWQREGGSWLGATFPSWITIAQTVVKRGIERENFDEMYELQRIMKENKFWSESIIGKAIAQEIREGNWDNNKFLDVFVANSDKFDVQTLLHCMKELLIGTTDSVLDEESISKRGISKILEILEKRSPKELDEETIERDINDVVMNYEYLCRLSSDQLIKMVEIFSSKIEAKNLFFLFKRAIRGDDLGLVKLLFEKRSDIDFNKFSINSFLNRIINPLLLLEYENTAKILKIFFIKMMQDSVYEQSCRHFLGMLFVYEKCKYLNVGDDAVGELGSVFLEEEKIGDNLNKLLLAVQQEKNNCLFKDGSRLFRDSICKLACEYGRFDILLLDKRIWEDPTLATQIIKAAIQQGALSVVEHYFNEKEEERIEIFSFKDLAEIFKEAVYQEREECLQKIEDKILSRLTLEVSVKCLVECLKTVITKGNLQLVKKVIERIEDISQQRQENVVITVEQQKTLFLESCQPLFIPQTSDEQLDNHVTIMHYVLELIINHAICWEKIIVDTLIEDFFKWYTSWGLTSFDKFKIVVKKIGKISSCNDDEIFETLIKLGIESKAQEQQEQALPFNDVLLSSILQDRDISISGQCLEKVLAGASDEDQIIGDICHNKNFHQVSIGSLWKAILSGERGSISVILRTIFSRKFLFVVIPPFLFIPLIGLARFFGGQIMNYIASKNRKQDG